MTPERDQTVELLHALGHLYARHSQVKRGLVLLLIAARLAPNDEGVLRTLAEAFLRSRSPQAAAAPNTDPGVNQIQCIDVIEFSRRDPGSQSAPMGPHPLANFQSYFKKVTRPRVGSAFGADSHPLDRLTPLTAKRAEPPA